MKPKKFSLITLFFCTLILLSSHAYGAANVAIIPSGDKSYSVQGSGMVGTAGIQLEIRYDLASFPLTPDWPKVTQGGAVSGAMFAANTTQPGYIRIAIISTNAFSANGQIATITFASRSGSGGITSVSTSMIDKAGAQLPSTYTYSNATAETVSPAIDQTPQAEQPGQATHTTGQTVDSGTATTAVTGAATTTANQIYPGTVTLPADLQQRADSLPAPTATSPDSTTDFTPEPAPAKIAEQSEQPEKTAADEKAPETAQYVVYKGIVDRFKLFKGEKKFSAMTALFDKKVTRNILQDPPVMLTDGKGKATLTVDFPAGSSTSPNFAVNGGKLLKFNRDKQVKGRWIVEVLPEVRSVRVTVTIIAGVEEFDYPLTVAPAAKTSLTLDEKGWGNFLKESGSVKAPRHDLNNDGVRDYIDEYIFVANYIVTKDAAAKTVKKK